MAEDYFARLKSQTQTRLWINNPSAGDLQRSIAEGAVGCTTNPAYCSKLLSSEPEYIHSLIDAAIREESDPEKAAPLIYRHAVKRVMNAFEKLYRDSGGESGFVTIQDDPRHDDDTERTLKECLENRELGPNYMAKIPVIPGGIEAIEACVEEDIPICATEVFSISQAVRVWDAYQAANRRAKKAPPLFITHISGIFDDYLGKLAVRTGVEIDPSVLREAGLAVARKQYAELKRRGFTGHMMGGGARSIRHFTGLVGGDAHITINWSTAQEILDSGENVTNTIDQGTPPRVINELREKFPDFRKAYDDDALGESEFSTFGPVQLFRNAFLKGWYAFLAGISDRKVANAV